MRIKFLHALTCVIVFLLTQFQQLEGQSGIVPYSKSSKHRYSLLKDQWTFRDGLPDWYGNAYLHDSRGFIWIHTNVGLVSFDGLEFKKIPFEDNLPINRIGEDINGNIWLLKGKVPGKIMVVDVLNPIDYSVKPLHQYLGLPQEFELFVEKGMLHFTNFNGKIWIGGSQEGFMYDGTWKKVFRNPSLDVPQIFNPGANWYPGPGKTNWLPTIHGNIALLNQQGQLLDSLPTSEKKVLHYWPDQNLGLWVALGIPGNPDSKSFLYLDGSSGKIKVTKSDFPKKTTWINNHFFHWEIGKLIQFGIEFKKESGKRIPVWRSKDVYINPSLNLDIFSNTGIFFIDREGSIWMSSTNGLFRYSLAPMNAFQTFLSDETSPISVRGMTEFDGFLYALTYSGVRKINLKSGVASEVYWPFNTLGLALINYKDHLFIGSNTPFLVKYSKTEDISLVGQKDQFWSVNCFFAHPELGLLAGSHQGIFKVDTLRMKFEFFALPKQTVFHFHSNKEGLWVLGSDGLVLLGKNGEILKHPLKPGEPYRFETATHLYEDPEGNFWISTRGAGLIFLNTKTGQTKQFSVENGFSHSNIHAVYADKTGCLWLPSDNGLMRFDPKINRLRTYYKSDGISDNEFNRLSHYKSKDGRFFFGGISGITAFYPEEIPWEYRPNPDLKVTTVRSFELKKGVFAYQNVDPDPAKSFILHPSDAFLEISISPFLFEEKKDYGYRWKIENVQEKWVEQTSNTIRLNNLPYGKHKLRVQFQRIGNPWSPKELVIPVDVLYPYYLTWPFLLAIGLVIAIAVGLILQWRTKKLVSENLQLENEVRTRTAQIEKNLATMAADRELISRQAEELRSIDEMKSRFFTNVTHELRTPLTLILGPIEQMIQKNATSDQARSLKFIRENAKKLLNLVEELLDLSKLENRQLEAKEEPIQLYPFLMRILSSYTPTAIHRAVELNFEFNCPMDSTILADGGKWEKIINNLLSNAFKYTPNGGKVELTVSKERASIVLEIKDTGHGIHPDDLPHIFDRFYQGKKGEKPSQGGSGIGLALSKEYARICKGELKVSSTLNKGTTFSLSPHLNFCVPRYPHPPFSSRNPLNSKWPLTIFTFLTKIPVSSL